MTDIVYHLEHVYKSYPGQKEPANVDICLQIQRGEIFGFLGDNGAGKTTLVRQMVNLLKSSSGQILLFGKPVQSSSLHAPLHVGYMPQDSYTLNNMTVGEALFFTARLRGLNRSDALNEQRRLLEAWKIADLSDKLNTRLSGGQRRLLRLAVAMAASPPVLILDEPTNDLDPQRRRLVWDQLLYENRERGATIIFITHDAIEAEKVVQRVGIMKQGRLAAVGNPGELKRSLDQKLRLEILFSPGMPPELPAGLEIHILQPGRWMVYLERQNVAATLEYLNFNQMDDFRLFSATLEDLYLYYARP